MGRPTVAACPLGPKRRLHVAPHRSRRSEGAMALRVAIVGCGRIGHKRAHALAGATLVAVADTEAARASELAKRFPGCRAEPDWQSCVARRDVDVVVVSTINASLATVTPEAVSRGK